MKIVLVSLMVTAVALASPILVRERRSWFSGHGFPSAVPHGLLAPGVPASALLAASFGAPGLYAALPTPVPAPAPAVVNPDYDDQSYDDGSYTDETTDDTAAPTAPVVAPALSGPTAVAAVTFPPLDPPSSTPAPAIVGPTLDGPTVPALVIHGPSGTIRTGPLSTGAVSLAGHVPPGHFAPVH